jgi:hypothetical protein
MHKDREILRLQYPTFDKFLTDPFLAGVNHPFMPAVPTLDTIEA